MKDSKKRKKSTAAHNTGWLKTDSYSLWTHKDLGDSAPLSITEISEYTQLFLWGDSGEPGHTMLRVPLLAHW